ncbi:MAG: acyl-CoA dehydrogenase, partial [Chloroflexi bacterium]
MSDRDRLASDASAIARKLVPIATSGAEGRVNRRLIGGLAEEGLLPRLFPRRAGGTRDEDVS